jgi:antibiotic biosynthesis monooxygenase (ABM) superfamily enzyme
MRSPTTGPATDLPPTGRATVVITERIRPGHEEAFQKWQTGVNAEVAAFAGFEGTEVLAPTGNGGPWTILYRFDTVDELEAWMASPDRESLLSEGAQHFDGPTSQQVLVSQDAAEPVTVVISHPVAHEHEKAFRAWIEKLRAVERTQPGFRGSHLYEPVPGVQDNWTAVYRFDTPEHLDAWLDSPARAALLEEGKRFNDFEVQRVPSPYGSWFSFGDEGEAAGPPPWKSALSVLVGLYPTVVLLTLVIRALWDTGPLWATLLVGNVVSSIILTWVVMPRISRLLRWWLAPAPGAETRRVDRLGAIVSIAVLTCLAFIFWLVTTQIWTLP